MGNTLPIQCYDLNGNHIKTFYKYADALKFCNHKSLKAIKDCADGKRNHAYGYRWKLSWDKTNI